MRRKLLTFRSQIVAGLKAVVAMIFCKELDEGQKSSGIWCVAANVRDLAPYGPNSLEIRSGIKKFNSGAKVYVGGAAQGLRGGRVMVVGHFRGKRYVTSFVETRHLTNFRAELAYSPAVVAGLQKIA